MRGPVTNMVRSASSALVCLIFLPVSRTREADLPHFRAENGTEQLVVHGKPFLIRYLWLDTGAHFGIRSAGTPMPSRRCGTCSEFVTFSIRKHFVHIPQVKGLSS
jgi:hypothetical protein